jgi:sulfoxide reductase heme-binding subunit YedZ
VIALLGTSWTKSPYLWYTSRATGYVALILLTMVITFGTLIATRVGGRRIGRFEINEFHRMVSMVTVLFVIAHVGTTVLDTYVPIGIISALVPFTSTYKTIPVAIGTIALLLMALVWISSLLKERLDVHTWRFIHWFSYASFAASVAHGFLTGSDAHSRWGLYLTVACLTVVATATVWRILGRTERAGGRTALSPLDAQYVATKPPTLRPPTPPKGVARRVQQQPQRRTK